MSESFGLQVAWWSSGAVWPRPSSSDSLYMWPASWRRICLASSPSSLTPTSLQPSPSTGPLCRACSTGPRCPERLWWASPLATWPRIYRSSSSSMAALFLVPPAALLCGCPMFLPDLPGTCSHHPCMSFFSFVCPRQTCPLLYVHILPLASLEHIPFKNGDLCSACDLSVVS